MFKKQTTGSVVCSSCGRLVGVNDERCFNCGKWNPGLWGYAPALNRLAGNIGFMEIVLGACSLLFLLSYAYAPQPMSGIFNLLSPKGEALYRFGASGLVPVFYSGRWWTVLSAGWLHGSLLHIAMNMWCLKSLVPVVAELYGTSRLVIIYTASSVAGFALTSTVGYLTGGRFGAGLTIGASAALLGLCGALIYYGRRSGSSMVTQQIVQWVVIIFVIGFFLPVIDNFAHLGGLAGGYVAARWLDPLRGETPAHGIAALACLAATVLALVVSFLTGSL